MRILIILLGIALILVIKSLKIGEVERKIIIIFVIFNIIILFISTLNLIRFVHG